MNLKTCMVTVMMTLIYPVASHAGWLAGTYEGTGLLNAQVEEKPDCIEITGKTGDSGMEISRITTKNEKSDLIVKVHWIACGVPHPLANKSSLQDGVKSDGLDHYKVPIASDINRVLMGTKRVVVWQRVAK